MTAAAKKVEEAPQAPEADGKRKYTKREPDTTPPGLLHTAVKNYAKFYRASDTQKAAEAEKEAAEARKQLAGTTDKEQQDELMKRIRLAENRSARIREREGKTVEQQRASLQEVIKLAQEQLSALPAE